MLLYKIGAHKQMKRLTVTAVALAVALLFCGAVTPASASTLWTQQWDSTPPFMGFYNGITVQIGNGAGEFSAPMSGFNGNNNWTTSGLNDQFTATAKAYSLLDGNMGPYSQWTFNFGSAQTTSFDMQLSFTFDNVVESRNTWHYNGTGKGNDPVGSWSDVS